MKWLQDFTKSLRSGKSWDKMMGIKPLVIGYTKDVELAEKAASKMVSAELAAGKENDRSVESLGRSNPVEAW